MIFFSVLLLWNGNFLMAQETISGKVKDLETGKVIPYVNIGILKTGNGTVSDKNGFFKLSIQNMNDTLLFSSIGYHAKKITVKQASKTKEIYLEEKIYAFENIIVEGKEKGRDKIFGNRIKKPGGGIGFVAGQEGDEIGALIEIKKTTYLKSAHFIVYEIAGDSMLYRINIYDFSNRELGENLLTKNVLINNQQRKGTISISLTDQNLVVSNDVLLVLELIKEDTNYVDPKTKNGLLFRYYEYDGKSGNIYMRYTSNSKNVGGKFKKVLTASLGFYFIGRELK